MKLFVGLGNPGAKYAANRHNVGFRAIDRMAEMHKLGPWRRRFQGEVVEGRIGEDRVLLLKPMTYMNESGRAVGEAVRFYKLRPEDVIVLHDELDVAPGKLKVKKGGGNAGHNGLKSITSHIGPEFWRVRIGIGHPGERSQVSQYVLQDFARSDAAWLDSLIEAIARAAGQLVMGGDARFLNDVARMTRELEPAHEAVHTAAPGHSITAAAPVSAQQPAAPAAPRPAPPASAERERGGLADKLRRWFGR
jgi:PTH1 family peptidyl-tRNA hydrolase